MTQPASPATGQSRTSPAENLMILRARLWDHLSPAERDELHDASAILAHKSPAEITPKEIDKISRELLAEVKRELKLANEIESEGIERVVYGKGHAELVELNSTLITALRGSTPIPSAIRHTDLVKRLREWAEASPKIEALITEAADALEGK